ncbi:MAG: DUF3298 domain-containing protein [Bacteroides sp.]|nr:DUF3298 domain-containing protein [Bacteroides sp.]
MKTTLAATAILLAGVMASCGSDSKDSGTFMFETYKFHETVRGADNDSVAQDIVDFDGIWDCEGAGVMPMALGKADIKALQDTLGALANVTIHDRKVIFSLPDYLRPMDDAKADTTKRGGSSLRKELTLDYMSGEMAVFRAYTYAYPQGAAHGIYSNRYVNYDLRDSRVLHLKDILTPNAAEALHDMVVERLREHYDLIVAPEEVKLPDNFKLSADGIDFVFPLYSVVPYSEGEAQVSFAAYEIDSYLTPVGRSLLLPDAE